MNCRFFKSIVAIILSITLLVTSVGCDFENTAEQANSTSITSELNDAFVELQFNEIQIDEVDVSGIDVNEIVVNSAMIESIESIEMEVVSANDEFVTLAYENFVSYYDYDIDLKKLFTDIAIGAGVIIVYVTLTHVGGPVGTYLAAIVTSEFTTSTLAIGAALDAAISGYNAYQEGGDVSYIVGHMINGVADGFKWAALVAPVTGTISGLNQFKAIKRLKKLNGYFSTLSNDDVNSIFTFMPDILKSTADLSEESTENMIKAVYTKNKDKFSKIKEEWFSTIVKNQNQIIQIVDEYLPETAKKINKVLQTQFWDKSGIKRNLLEQFRLDTKYPVGRYTIYNIDSLSDEVQEYILNNTTDFIKCYRGTLLEPFWDSLLKEKNIISATQINEIKNCITVKNSYIQLINNPNLGIGYIDELLSDPEKRLLLEARFGVNNINNVVNVQSLYKRIDYPEANQENVKKVINGIIEGTIKSVEEINGIDTSISQNILGSRSIISKILDKLNLTKKTSGLLDNLAKAGLKKSGLKDDIVNSIISGSGKAKIISELGQDAYDQLLSNRSVVIQELLIQAPSSRNVQLIRELTTDALAREGIPESEINTILSFASIKAWRSGSEKSVKTVYNITADYYQATNTSAYMNFIDEYAELRGVEASQFAEQNGIKLINSKYAGSLMEPVGDNSEYIKKTYGDIFMSESGFPIFDEYAIARVELDDLTGIESQDIPRANRLRFGSAASLEGYTWHHLEDGRTLILIPTELHEAYRHTGGASLIREGMNG